MNPRMKERLLAVYEPETYAVRCTECDRELVCDDGEWSYGDDFTYREISEPKETTIGHICMNCYEDMPLPEDLEMTA